MWDERREREEEKTYIRLSLHQCMATQLLFACSLHCEILPDFELKPKGTDQRFSSDSR